MKTAKCLSIDDCRSDDRENANLFTPTSINPLQNNKPPLFQQGLGWLILSQGPHASMLVWVTTTWCLKYRKINLVSKNCEKLKPFLDQRRVPMVKIKSKPQFCGIIIIPSTTTTHYKVRKFSRTHLLLRLDFLTEVWMVCLMGRSPGVEGQIIGWWDGVSGQKRCIIYLSTTSNRGCHDEMEQYHPPLTTATTFLHNHPPIIRNTNSLTFVVVSLFVVERSPTGSALWVLH